MTGPTLSAPFKNTETLRKGGATLTYVPAPEVVDRLNAVWGVGSWSYTCDVVHLDKQCVVVKGRLVAPSGAVVEQFGGQEIKYRRDSEVPVDLGDEFKGAASDAFKKAAQHFGVGLYLALGHSPIGVASSGGDGQTDAPSSPPPADLRREPAGEVPASAPVPAEGFDANAERARLHAELEALPESVQLVVKALRIQRRLNAPDGADVNAAYVAAWETLVGDAKRKAADKATA